MTLARGALELGLLGGLAVTIVVVVRLVLVQAFYIPSGSMLPQLQLQDKVVVSRLAYRFHSPRRGDIVVFSAPPNMPKEGALPHGGSALRRGVRWVGQRLGLAATTDELIKRVIALPGETVEGHGGHIYVNGRLLLEPYLPAGTEMVQSFGPVKIPRGRLWVMGDHRNNSYDSRFFGPIRERTIVGRAFLRVWPVTHISFL